MPRGREFKPPIYVLPHGIEVVGEYPPDSSNRYWRVRLRPHPFFPGVREISNGILVHRSRAILASKLGRPLTPAEHAHHGDENRSNDAPGNVERLTAAEHNRHHKTGTKHTPEAKRRISAGLKKAIAEGRRKPPVCVSWKGRRHTDATRQRISAARKALIASGSIQSPIPPSNKGTKLSTATKEKMRQAKLNYWQTKKGLAP